MSARRWISSLLLLGALGSAGCANLRVGTSFDPARQGEIQPGLSERAAVRALLGPPLRTARVGDLTVELHEFVTPDSYRGLLVSYRGETVVKVTPVE